MVDLWTTKVSGSYFLHSFKGLAIVLRALISKFSIKKLNSVGFMSDPIAAPPSCS